MTAIKPDAEVIDHPLPPPTPDMVLATADMLDPLTPASFEEVPGFPPLQMRDIKLVRAQTEGKVAANVVKANPGVAWVGSPWHLHHLDCQIFFVTKGTADFEFEGIGQVHLQEGSIMYQPPVNRHREMGYSSDNETLLLTLPSRFKTTLYIYNDEAKEYNELTFDTDDPELGDYGNVEHQDESS